MCKCLEWSSGFDIFGRFLLTNSIYVPILLETHATVYWAYIMLSGCSLCIHHATVHTSCYLCYSKFSLEMFFASEESLVVSAIKWTVSWSLCIFLQSANRLEEGQLLSILIYAFGLAQFDTMWVTTAFFWIAL